MMQRKGTVHEVPGRPKRERCLPARFANFCLCNSNLNCRFRRRSRGVSVVSGVVDVTGPIRNAGIYRHLRRTDGGLLEFSFILSSRVDASPFPPGIVLTPSSSFTMPFNYRPISHLSFLSKLTERVVKLRLTHHLSSNDLLNSFQSAYTKHHSTESTLLSVHDQGHDSTENHRS